MLSSNCSGAIYKGVPIGSPVVVKLTSFSISFASSKSINIADLFFSFIIIFPGFISL